MTYLLYTIAALVLGYVATWVMAGVFVFGLGIAFSRGDEAKLKKFNDAVTNETKMNHVWFTFVWLKWYSPLGLVRGAIVVMAEFNPNTPFTGMSAVEVEEAVDWILFAANNGCPMDLPREIHEWVLEGKKDKVTEKDVTEFLNGFKPKAV